MIQYPETGEDCVKVMFHKVRIAGRDQRKHLRASVRHVGRGIEPVLEKEKKTKNKPCVLSLSKEVGSQKERNKPLQQSASPQPERWSKPPEQIMPALVDDK